MNYRKYGRTDGYTAFQDINIDKGENEDKVGINIRRGIVSVEKFVRKEGESSDVVVATEYSIHFGCQ